MPLASHSVHASPDYPTRDSRPMPMVVADGELAGNPWLGSRLKLVLLALAFALAIFVVSVGIDAFMLREHDSPRAMIEMSDAFAGLVAGALFFLYGYQRRKEVLRRLETISLMNHHIRNALQIISSSAYITDEKSELAAINQSVQRIQWALREILPKI
jgi:hypothetical protein